MLLQAVENTFAILTGSCLTNIDDAFIGLIRCPEQEINAALFQIIAIFAAIQFCPRNLKSNPCPVGKRAFINLATKYFLKL